MLNLECCVSDRGRKWPDKTYYFRADPDFAVSALDAAGATVVSLANNHSLDFGERALADTRAHLTDADIAHAGAGPDREAAFAPAIAEVDGLTVATLALTDQQRSYAATDDTPGTVFLPLDRSNADTRRAVTEALERARRHDPDLVVTSLHWGPNWETAPADQQRGFAHWLVERGVDVIHGHSAHVLQGVERYRGTPIIYDAGDFVDDYIHKENFHNKRSALFELILTDGTLDRLRVVPIEIEDETAMMADSPAAEWVRETMRDRSAAFGTTVERAGAGLAVSL